MEFAAVKAVATGLATLVGWLIIGGHPFWVTFGAQMVIKPSRHDTNVKAVNRLIWTTLGAIVGHLFFAVLGSTALLALFIVTLFLLVATQTVHYAVFVVFFVTLNVVLSGALGGSAGDQLSIDRLVASHHRHRHHSWRRRRVDSLLEAGPTSCLDTQRWWWRQFGLILSHSTCSSGRAT